MDERFGGVIQALADAIERDHAQVWQWLHGRRAISEKTAAHIEAKLDLAPGTLSGQPNAGKVVSNVVDALPQRERDEVVQFLMFKLQHTDSDLLGPEKFAAYMKLLTQLRAAKPPDPTGRLLD